MRHIDRTGTGASPSITLYVDGACQPVNPGGVAVCAFLACQEGMAEALTARAGYLCEGDGATNNMAEYWAIIKALAWVWNTDRTQHPLVLKSDSQLCIKQLRQEWRLTSAALRPLWERAMRGLDPLTCELVWIPREENTAVDRLTYQAYQAHCQKHGAACLGKTLRGKYGSQRHR